VGKLSLHHIDPPGGTLDHPAPIQGTAPAEPFPLDALPHPLSAFVAEAAAALGCDGAMVALPAIAVCGSLIGNTRTISLKSDWQEPSVFWTCVVADSGTLKSPAHDVAVRPLQRLQKRLQTEHAARMAQYESEHEEWKNRKKRDAANAGPEPEKPIMPRVVCSDITVERLGELLEQNPRGILCARDEQAGWFNSFTRYKGKGGASDLPAWLEMHRASMVIIDRKTSVKQTLFIDRAAVSVCGTIQPGILAKAVRGDFLDSGLVARLLLAMPPKTQKQWRKVGIDPATTDAYERLLESLYRLDFGADGGGERVPVALDLDSDAEQVWEDFYNDFAAEQAAAAGASAAALSKLEGYAARFALLHHICKWAASSIDDRFPIGAESVKAGIKLARWFASEIQRVYATFGETGEQRETRRLVEFIQTRGGSITAREMQRANNRKYLSAAAAELALNSLAGAGFGEWINPIPGERGRPAKVFRLHDTIPIGT
jgi:hypothetical protein